MSEQKKKRFWRRPDHYLTAIILGDDQVYGKVKGDLALLDGVPKPGTGYFYKDIVKVIGPTGMQPFRDEEIPVFKAVGIYKKSNLPTFTFYAMLPTSKDYFYLLEEFKGKNLRARFTWFPNGNPTTWEKGYCAADKLETAKKLLEQFVSKAEGRKVKDIDHWDYYKNKTESSTNA
ncbi:MAG: hypothetical protein JJE25_06490 [Bacteroidia bacterium]|nr:hypothetical protein [Bacteroidia bacterium]